MTRQSAPAIRTAAPTLPALAGGWWARFTGIDPYRYASRRRIDTPPRAWLMEGVSAGGVLLSVVVAGIGVAGMIGFASPLAKVGSVVLIAATLLTEVAACRLPTHAQARFAEGGVAGWLKGSLVVLGFGALTGWNLIAAHFGAVAIDHAALQDRRAPLERAAAEADAARETAEEALAAHDAEAREERESMALALRGAFESGYITSSSRNAREAAGDRAERRVALAQAVTDARGRDRAAERALEAAPKPRPDLHLWLFACVLELVKGCLVWFATAGERRNKTTLKSGHFIADDPRTLSPAERRELKSRCASILATIRHMEAARA